MNRLLAFALILLVADPVEAASTIDCDKPCEIVTREPDAARSAWRADRIASLMQPRDLPPLIEPVLEVPPLRLLPFTPEAMPPSMPGKEPYWLAAALLVLPPLFDGSAPPPRAVLQPPPPQPIPEPATWAMLLAGFAAIGASRRARRREAAHG